MRSLLTALALLAFATPAAAQNTTGQVAPKAGVVHCETVEGLTQQADSLRASGMRAWRRVMQDVQCRVAEVGERFELGGVVDEFRNDTVVCIVAEAWEGCRYILREETWTPPE